LPLSVGALRTCAGRILTVDVEEYLCRRCDELFYVFKDADLACPRCLTQDPEDLEEIPSIEEQKEYNK
jgi:hypothetical protein